MKGLYILIILLIFPIAILGAIKQDLLSSQSNIFTIMKPGTSFRKTISIKNNSLVVVTVQAYVWDLWFRGDVEVYAPSGTFPFSAAQWITIQPQKMKILPGKSANFQMQIFVPAGASGGNYAAIFFDTTPPINLFSGKKVQSHAQNYKLGIPTYIDVEGTSHFDLGIKKFNISKIKNNGLIKSEFIIKNNGNVHIRPSAEIAIFNQNRKYVKHFSSYDLLSSKTLLPGQEALIKGEWKKMTDPGSFTAVLTVNYGSSQSKRIQREFR